MVGGVVDAHGPPFDRVIAATVRGDIRNALSTWSLAERGEVSPQGGFPGTPGVKHITFYDTVRCSSFCFRARDGKGRNARSIVARGRQRMSEGRDMSSAYSPDLPFPSSYPHLAINVSTPATMSIHTGRTRTVRGRPPSPPPPPLFTSPPREALPR